MLNSLTKRVSLTALFSLIALVAVSLGFVTQVGAFGNYPDPIIDGFNRSFLHPDPRANWWIINWGEENGVQGIFEDYEGPYSSFSIEREGWKKFGRLTVGPQDVSGFYTNVDVAEEHTGYPAEIVNEWKPTPEKSVQLRVMARWSEGFNVAGDGGAIGSSGVWLWNSPYDVNNYDPYALNRSFGFNYNEAGSFGGFLGGLTFNVFYDNNPLYVVSAPSNIDMQEWNEFKMLWSVDNLGVESIEFFINDSLVGSTVLPVQMGTLSTEIWNDNQHAIVDENGFQLLFENPEYEQHFDVDNFVLRTVFN